MGVLLNKVPKLPYASTNYLLGLKLDKNFEIIFPLPCISSNLLRYYDPCNQAFSQHRISTNISMVSQMLASRLGLDYICDVTRANPAFSTMTRLFVFTKRPFSRRRHLRPE